MMAGGAIALVALTAGIFVHRSLRGTVWAPLAAADEAATPRPPAPAWAMGPPTSPAFPRPVDRAGYETGRRLLAAGDAKAALGPLTEAARTLRGNPDVVHDYGLALVRTGQEGLGLFQLEYASRLAPGIRSYRLDFIRALLAAGRRGPAARELGELLARDPTDAVVSELLAGLDSGAVGAPSRVDGDGPAPDAARPGPVEGGSTFTNADLGRPPAAPRPVPVSPVVTLPSAAPPAGLAAPSPPA
jgi:hypothetical protein